MSEPDFKISSEMERLSLAEKMSVFAEDKNLPKISDDEMLPGDPCDWDNAKTSLMAHAAISKLVRVLANVAASDFLFLLQKFEAMRPATCLDEIGKEIIVCTDAETLQKLQKKFRVQYEVGKVTSEIRPLLWMEAKIHRHDMIRAADTIINYCKSIVAAWLEKIPAQNFRDLLSELERLENMSLRAKFQFFGLTDFLFNI
jgi:hypothetical protein